MPESTLSPAEQEAVDEILAVFDAYREAEIALAADPQPIDASTEQLSTFLASPLLTTVATNLNTMHRNGFMRTGRPVWEPNVTELSIDGDVTALIRDCFDASDWLLVERDSGEAAPSDLRYGALPHPGAPFGGRYVMEFKASVYDVDGEQKWLLREGQVERESAC